MNPIPGVASGRANSAEPDKCFESSRRDGYILTPNAFCSRRRMSPHIARISSSVIGTLIPMQSKGCGSSWGCLATALGLLRLVCDTFVLTESRSVQPPSSFRTFNDKPTFLRNSLSSLRCSAVELPSTDTKEEDSRWRSLIPKASIILRVVGVGNRAIVHLDNLSYAWSSKAAGTRVSVRPMETAGTHDVLEKMYSRICG